MAENERTQVDAGGSVAQHRPTDEGAEDAERPDDAQRADQPVGDGPEEGRRPGGPGPPPSQRPDRQGPDGADETARAPGASGTRSWVQLQSDSFRAAAERVHLGALVAGIALVVLGVLLLGGTEVAWRGLLDAVLALVGLALILGSRRHDNRRALVVAGLVLAVVMLGVWRADVPLQGGMRFHTVSPTTSADLRSPYHQTAGTLTIDLRHYQRSAAATPLVASLGIGRLVVIVLPGTVLQGAVAVGEGRVSVVGVNRNGVGLEVPLAAATVPALARADLRVGVGTVEVQVGKSP